MQVCTSLQTDNHASTPPLILYQLYILLTDSYYAIIAARPVFDAVAELTFLNAPFQPRLLLSPGGHPSSHLCLSRCNTFHSILFDFLRFSPKQSIFTSYISSARSPVTVSAIVHSIPIDVFAVLSKLDRIHGAYFQSRRSMLTGAARRGYFRLDRVTNKEVNTSRHGYIMRQIKMHDAVSVIVHSSLFDILLSCPKQSIYASHISSALPPAHCFRDRADVSADDGSSTSVAGGGGGGGAVAAPASALFVDSSGVLDASSTAYCIRPVSVRPSIHPSVPSSVMHAVPGVYPSACLSILDASSMAWCIGPVSVRPSVCPSRRQLHGVVHRSGVPPSVRLSVLDASSRS